MRSYEERVAETKRRIAARQREKRLRRNTVTMASAVAACLALHSGAALGYIIIGLLAFLLGVCVTVLCFRIQQLSRENAQDKESEDAHGAD